jgi:aminopeptidase-like protein
VKPDEDAGIGNDIYELVRRLYPICRSITGDGVRETLAILAETIPLQIEEVPTGTQVYDWAVPKEWNVREAWIKDAEGRTVVDFKNHNLHLMSYSTPVKERLPLAELKKHIHTLPEHPDWIPYRTSYYAESWAFCMTDRQLRSLADGLYEVEIDATLAPGHLTYGEFFHPGETDQEVLFFAHCCHPSLCNDNLSGLSILAHLGRWLATRSRRFSYRIVFGPGTIGSLTWLSRNESRLENIRYGLVASLLGDPGPFTYKQTRDGDRGIDHVVAQALKETGDRHEVIDFVPWGYDERQFGSPGFNLPVGRITRTPNGEYAEYHSSADNLELVQPRFLGESFELLRRIVEIIEGDAAYLNQSPRGEPQLGRRGLYGSVGGAKRIEDERLALLWTLNLSDGQHTLLDIARRSGLSFRLIRESADALLETELLSQAPE